MTYDLVELEEGKDQFSDLSNRSFTNPIIKDMYKRRELSVARFDFVAHSDSPNHIDYTVKK